MENFKGNSTFSKKHADNKRDKLQLIFVRLYLQKIKIKNRGITKISRLMFKMWSLLWYSSHVFAFCYFTRAWGRFKEHKIHIKAVHVRRLDYSIRYTVCLLL